MAGRGPAPKPVEQRRRRHKLDVSQDVPASGYSGAFPELSRSYRADGESVVFLADTREWYSTWARSPQACGFTGTDWTRLGMLARLVDSFYRTPRPPLLAEIRLQEGLLGGSPLDRRRLGIRIEAAEPERDAQLVAIADYKRELGA